MHGLYKSKKSLKISGRLDDPNSCESRHKRAVINNCLVINGVEDSFSLNKKKHIYSELTQKTEAFFICVRSIPPHAFCSNYYCLQLSAVILHSIHKFDRPRPSQFSI